MWKPSIDFPDEDIAPDEGTQTCARARFASGRKCAICSRRPIKDEFLREGVRASSTAPTNAGKSSLLNRLLGYERAIVSEMPGTTRDTIEEVINLRGIPLRLLDTAGLRESDDELEQAGIARTEKSLASGRSSSARSRSERAEADGFGKPR